MILWPSWPTIATSSELVAIRAVEQTRVAQTADAVCALCATWHTDSGLRLVRGSTLRRVDTVIVSVQGSHRDGKSSALGTSCRVLCVETLMVCSRIISSTYNDTNTTLITVRISHEVLRPEFRSLGGFFLHCVCGRSAGSIPTLQCSQRKPWKTLFSQLNRRLKKFEEVCGTPYSGHHHALRL